MWCPLVQHIQRSLTSSSAESRHDLWMNANKTIICKIEKLPGTFSLSFRKCHTLEKVIQLYEWLWDMAVYWSERSPCNARLGAIKRTLSKSFTHSRSVPSMLCRMVVCSLFFGNKGSSNRGWVHLESDPGKSSPGWKPLSTTALMWLS